MTYCKNDVNDINGHESKPAICIFRKFIIFSKIAKLDTLQILIEF